MYHLNFYITKYAIFKQPLLITATFLDIRSKHFTRSSEACKKEYVKIATAKIKSLLSFTEQPSTTVLSPVKKRLNIFGFDEPVKTSKSRKKLSGIDLEIFDYNAEAVKNQDPLQYLLQNKSIFPNLFLVVKMIFCIPGTSVPSEQLFSHAGYNVWDRRNKLKPSNVNKVMVIYENMD